MDEDHHCYCGNLDTTEPAGTFQCQECRKRFHADCLKSPIQTPLHADTFYKFKCSDCAENNTEEYDRAKISWQEAVHLALYNLQLGGGGKCGYFRWKEHICGFIDKHWAILFGSHRKKTTTWFGTIAGTLSANCPQRFVSGTAELGGCGWWKLAQMKPPVYHIEAPKVSRRSRQPNASEVIMDAGWEKNILDRPRRSKPFSLTAASELKAKRTPMSESTGRRKKMVDWVVTPPATELPGQHPESSADTSCTDQSSPVTSSDQPDPSMKEALLNFASESYTSLMSTAVSSEEVSAQNQSENSHCSNAGQSPHSSNQGDVTCDDDLSSSPVGMQLEMLAGEQEEMAAPAMLIDNADNDDSMEIDPGSMSPVAVDSNLELRLSPGMDELMKNITGDEAEAEQLSKSVPDELDSEMDSEGPSEEEEDESEEEEEEEEEEEQEAVGSGDRVPAQRRGSVRKKRKREEENLQEKKEEEIPSNLHMMTPYDENLILKQLNSLMSVQPLTKDGELPLPEWEVERIVQARNRLRRKLIVRKLKRDNGLPVFDLDTTMTMLSQKYWGVQPHNTDSADMCVSLSNQSHARTLDRYMMPHRGARVVVQHTSFRTRLVGFQDDQLQPITSPYTMRVLKPFIRRDAETVPLKIKLLQEIVAYHHRNDPSWKPPPPASLDYCYVRPQHIPSVNALCRASFWPGIDLSECLQYPDFSCIVMYKKVVVAFAFMVPDVKHNEAYISFIHTHPEWRRAGIATFMLYHLIQTCMGKDVTLHVSAKNPAMMLYQKFGFKAEELCLDFYDKYFPVDSRECKHAFFMRMRR